MEHNPTYRTFRYGAYTFSTSTREDGAVQVDRISPYDETEYHWALKPAGRNFWRILRDGKRVSTVGPFVGGELDPTAEPFTPEQIAYFLIKADTNAHLEPCICHN